MADVIDEALESVFAQTLPALEVIVCDDGSTDDLRGALEPHRDRILLVEKEHGGEGSAKNTASRLAKGDFLAILDADDRYLPRRLEALAHLARQRPDLEILTTDAYLEANGRTVRRCYAGGWTFDPFKAFIIDRARTEVLCFISTNLSGTLRGCKGGPAIQTPDFVDVRVLAASDIVVMPSRAEGLPHLLLEALAVGRPVLASRVGGIPDVVHDGETGLLVPPDAVPAVAEGLRRLLADPELASQLGRAGQRYVQRHCSPERAGRRLASVYRAVLAERA